MNKNKVKNLFWSFGITVLIAIVVSCLIAIYNIAGNSVCILFIAYGIVFLSIWHEIYGCVKGE
jgi:hypothetical protein